MSLPPFLESSPHYVPLTYVIPEKVRQGDVQQLKNYLTSVHSIPVAKKKVNNLQSRERLEKGVHDNLQRRLDRASGGGKHKRRSQRYKKRSSRKTRTKRRNTATRRR